ncbi:MAG: hypothetical protein N2445_01165 [Acidobacteria bacterium]|nr:hypothetical protein [Acidobacteriota bacterium]
MAANEVPLTIAERHKILFQDNTPKEVLIEYGKKYLAKEMLYDALEYFEKAQANRLIEEIKRKSVEEADFVLYQNVCRALKIELDINEMTKLKENAMKMGKDSVASAVAMYLISKEKK